MRPHLLLATAILMLSTLPARADDPLFARMQGQWIGAGERVQLLTGHRTRIDAQVDAEASGDRLVSRNQIVETAIGSDGQPTGSPRSYDRVYWIASEAAAPGTYDLGAGESGPAASQGRFTDGSFETEQDFGALIVRSKTSFGADSTVYEETSWQGTTETSETRIEYRRK